MLKVTVTGYRFFGKHGVFAQEQELGVQLVADIIAHVDIKVCGTDKIKDTVDYIELADMLEAVSENRSYSTLEALGWRFCQECLREWRVINRVTVKIRKPAPPAAVAVDSVGIEVTASRDA